MNELKEMCDPFYADVRENAAGVLQITITKTARMEGWKKGTKLRLIGQEVEPNKGEQE